MLTRDPQTIRNTLRKVRKDLAGRLWLTDHERIVEPVLEADLDECRVAWSLWHAAWRLHILRHVRRDARRH